MTAIQVIFYMFAFIAVASGVVVISAKNPVHSVLSLVVTFFSMAAIWMLLRAEFLSLILILVYVGAVMTLFLFVVMMLNVDISSKREGFVKYLPFALVLVVVMTGLMMVAIGPAYLGFNDIVTPAAKPADYSNITTLGRALFTDYVFAFEVAGVLLLAAIIAAIMLAHRGPKHRKIQCIDEQLSVKAEDRVRMVKMKAEPKQSHNDRGDE